MLVLDSGLTVLHVVGRAGRSLIERHKRLGGYRIRDFERLAGLTAQFDRILFSPNVLTEASNLIAYGLDEPTRDHVRAALASAIDAADERYVESRVAARRPEFVRLGLTDAALLEMRGADRTLVTSDAMLHIAAQTQGFRSINFEHLRAQR